MTLPEDLTEALECAEVFDAFDACLTHTLEGAFIVREDNAQATWTVHTAVLDIQFEVSYGKVGVFLQDADGVPCYFSGSLEGQATWAFYLSAIDFAVDLHSRYVERVAIDHLEAALAADIAASFGE